MRKKIFSLNNHKLKKYKKIAEKIINLEEEYSKLSDGQLKDKTNYFKKRIANGESLDNLLVEAYAVIREVDFRLLGMKPFENQVLAAVVLHFGNIAELATGEGKTLTATMPMYLNGLTGPGNFVITANGYLAARDAEDMGVVYKWMGLTCTSSEPEHPGQKVNKQEIYGHDIVYTTNTEMGFDYLFDNLADKAESKSLGKLNFALVDEVDSVLLDSAQTALVISGAPRVQSNLFNSMDALVKTLIPEEDYELSDDEKNAWFTEYGLEHIERYLDIDNILSEENAYIYRQLILALKANVSMRKDRDYVVRNGEVLLLSMENGRELEGMKLEGGMHQAIEAKEGVKVTTPTRAMATITIQNFFKLFNKVSGMTGTAKTSQKEFNEVYNLQVLQIPTHKPNIRIDRPDRVYADLREKLHESIKYISEVHATGRPILIETGSVTLSELYSIELLKIGIPHNVLNARVEAQEANIIAEAGQKGSITVATSMAGRGTDIKLGPGVVELGGLLVLGTERLSSFRIDNQLRGRAGRQGDPGESVFFVSLDDKVVISSGAEWVAKYRLHLLDLKKRGKRVPNQELKRRRDRKIVVKAQKRSESSKLQQREQTVKMDKIVTIQRNLIYKFRDDTMANNDLLNLAKKIIDHSVESFLKKNDLTSTKVIDFISNCINFAYNPKKEDFERTEIDDLRELIYDEIEKVWNSQVGNLMDDNQKNYLLRVSILKAIDVAWIEQVDTLKQLQTVVASRSSARHSPEYEFEREAKKSFEQMKQMFWRETLKNIMLSQLTVNKDGSIRMDFP